MDYTRCVAEIRLSSIANNMAGIRAMINPQAQIMAVVKADAYGHGALEVSKTALAAGAAWLGVATAEEGVFLRENGIAAPILIFGVSIFNDVSVAVENGLTLTVCDLQSAWEASAAAVRLNKTADIHIKLDTGMSRLGFLPSQGAVDDILEISRLGGINITGIYSHLAASDSADGSFSHEQSDRFRSVLNALKDNGLDIPIVHISNSGSVLRHRELDFSMVRVGIALYGLPPSSDEKGCEELQRLGFEEALCLKARVSSVKEVEQGVTVGYSRTYVTSKKTKIATVTIGYADGYSRHLSNKGRVLIGGEFAPIIGNVCMDQLMVDVTHIDAEVGDEVVLIGAQGRRKITATEVAALQGTINYETVTGISKRVPRKYI